MYKATAIIHGNLVNSEEQIKIFSPLNNECIGTIPALTEEQINEAFLSSTIAFNSWKKIDPKMRQEILLSFAEKIRQHSLLLMEMLHKEVGKNLIEAKNEIDRSVEYIVETIHAYSELVENPEEYQSDHNVLVPKNIIATYLREPHGIVLTISPFNFPVNLMLSKVVPAILMGNCVIHKSATQGSLCGWYLAKLFNEITFEKFQMIPGIFNYITGKGSVVGKALYKRQEVNALSFTGSTEVGLEISSHFPAIPKQLEMGGLNVAIVLDDADISKTCTQLLKGAFGFSGQRCTSIKKAYIHKKIYKNLIEEIQHQLPEYEKDMEPLINKSAVDLSEKFYEDALLKNGELVTKPINWKEITDLKVPRIIIKNMNNEMFLSQEELFGPILGLASFENIEDLLKEVNKSEYGLQASVFSMDLDLASQIALELEVSRVNINLAPSRSPDIFPFSGTKKSGLEVQGIKNSLYFFSKFKGVVLDRGVKDIT